MSAGTCVLSVSPGATDTGLTVFRFYPVAGWKMVHAETIHGTADPALFGKRSERAAEKIKAPVEGVRKLVREFGIKVALFEIPTLGENQLSIEALYISLGWTTAVISTLRLKVGWYAPQDVRWAVMGNQWCSPKKIIAKMKRKHESLKALRLICDAEHAADSAAVFEAALGSEIIMELEAAG